MKLIRCFSTVLAILCLLLSSCSSEPTATDAPDVPPSLSYDPTRDLMEGDTDCYEPQLVLRYPEDKFFSTVSRLQQAVTELSDKEFRKFAFEYGITSGVLMTKEDVALWISMLEQRGFFVLSDADSYYAQCDPYTYQLETNGYEMTFTHMYVSFSKDGATYRFRYNWLNKAKPTPRNSRALAL